MNIWVTADPHFGHKNIIFRCNRPFSSLEEMDDTLIYNWNSQVGKSDAVYVLGDFLFRQNEEYFLDVFNRLNGRKYLIRGNHDEPFAEKHFLWTKDYFELQAYNFKFILFHYPLLSWKGKYKGKTVHLYGHVHNNTDFSPIIPLAFNVGVDVNGFTPVSLKNILQEFQIKLTALKAKWRGIDL